MKLLVRVPRNDDSDLVAEVSIYEVGFARLAKVEEQTRRWFEEDVALISVRYQVVDDEMELDSHEHHEELLVGPDNLVFEDVMWVDDDFVVPGPHVRDTGWTLVIERTCLYWRSYEKHSYEVLETDSMGWDKLRCDVHGWDEDAADTCLACLAEDA